MPLIKNRYGKGRVRVMRIHRDGERHDVSQLNIKAMVEGDFGRTYTHHDNSSTVSTDTFAAAARSRTPRPRAPRAIRHWTGEKTMTLS